MGSLASWATIWGHGRLNLTQTVSPSARTEAMALRRERATDGKPSIPAGEMSRSNHWAISRAP